MRWRFWVALGVVLLAMAFVGPAGLLALPIVFGATTEITDIDEAQKIIFSDLHENFVTDTELMDLFETDMNVKTEETTGGRYIEAAQYFRLPGAVRSIAIGDPLPVPFAPLIKNSKIYLRKHTGILQMTGDTMRRVKGDIGAYLNWMERALPDLLTRFNDMIDRELVGYGNGARARIATAGITGNVITVDRALGITGWTNAWLQFQDGESIVASADADSDPLRNAGSGQACQVVDIDPTNSKITVDSIPGAWAAGDYIFGGDVGGGSGQIAGTGEDRELMGMTGLIDDGTVLTDFQGLTRATYRPWRSKVVDAQVAPFTGEFSEELISFSDNRVFVEGAGKPTDVICAREAAERYWILLKGDRQLVNPKAYEGGKGPLFMRLPDRLLPIRVARKLPPEVAFMPQRDTLRKWTLAGMWDDITGSIWNRVTSSAGRFDDFFAVYIWYCQTGNINPQKSVRIQNMVN